MHKLTQLNLTKAEVLSHKESKVYQYIIKEASFKYESYIAKALNAQDKDISKSFLDKAFGIAETLSILENLLEDEQESEPLQYH